MGQRNMGKRTGMDRSQEQLWADCLAEQPDIIGDIMSFIAAARTQLVESPPVAPSDDEHKSEPEPGKREPSNRK